MLFFFFKQPKTRGLVSLEDNVWNENMSCKRSINKTYPLSTRKESLHVLPFLFNWNLESENSCQTVIFALKKHALNFQMPSLYGCERRWYYTFIFGLYILLCPSRRRHFDEASPDKSRQITFHTSHNHLICNILNGILKVSAKCQDTVQNN